MSVGSARSLKAGVGCPQALIKESSPWFNKGLIWPPPPRRITLLMHHPQALRCRAQILLVAEHQIRLHRRAEGIHVTVRVLAHQGVVTFCQWSEVVFFDEAL